MYARPTTMAEAFINATAKLMREKKVDHQAGKGNWVARRVAIQADSGSKTGIVRDYDHWPKKTAK